MCQSHIESATAHSDETIARNDGFWRALDETKARQVMVYFKFDVLYR